MAIDWKFWSTFAINVIGLGLLVQQIQIMKQQLVLPSPRSAKRLSLERQLARRLWIPVIVLGALILLSWAPYAVRALSPTPMPNLLAGWSGFDKGCNSQIDTSPIVKFKDDYHVFLICSISDASIDAMQNEQIGISKPFTITSGLVDVAIVYDSSSKIAQVAKLGTLTSMTVVLLPKDKDGTSIKKIADVEAQGGKLLLPGTAL